MAATITRVICYPTPFSRKESSEYLRGWVLIKAHLLYHLNVLKCRENLLLAIPYGTCLVISILIIRISTGLYEKSYIMKKKPTNSVL